MTIALLLPLASGCGGDGASGGGAGSVDLSGSLDAANKAGPINKAAAARSKGMSGDAAKTKR